MLKNSENTHHNEVLTNIIDIPRHYSKLPRNFSKVTDRELECLYCFATGKNSAETGNFLNISKRTVESHMQNIKTKVGINKTTALIYHATKQQLI